MVDSSNKRLFGWKEIARFLGVTVRAAQIWEKERGLPVHRMPGEARPRVYANTDDLEAWLAEGDIVKASETSEPGAANEPSVEKPVPGRWRRSIRFGVPLASALVVSSALLIALWSAPPRLARCAIVGDVLRAEDERGEIVWQKAFPGLAPRSEPRPEYPACVVADVEVDGRPEVVLQFQHVPRLAENGRLVLFGEEGEVRWQYSYGRAFEYGDRLLPALFAGRIVRLVNVGGRPMILSVAVHQPRFPSEIALVDPEAGQPVERYFHPGHVYTLLLRDVDADGRDELLFGAVNNPGPAKPHAVVGVLDLPFSGDDGARRVERNVFGEPGPRPLAYLAFPRPAIFEAEEIPAYVGELGFEDPRSASVVVTGGALRFYYRLDLSDLSAPRVIDVTVPPEVRAAYRDAHARGRLATPEVDLAAARQIRVFDAAPAGCSAAFSAGTGPPSTPSASPETEAPR